VYIVGIYGGIRCDTPEEAVALVHLYVSQQRRRGWSAKEFRRLNPPCDPGCTHNEA
jgi:hypothetical protein